jgi:hypothetical protein
MQQQSVLRHLASHHDFTRANQVVAMHQAQPFIRSWMALDLCTTLASQLSDYEMQFASPYENSDFIKYDAKSDLIEHCKPRFASRADLKITTPKETFWYEFHGMHQNELASAKGRNKLYKDAQRLQALRRALPDDQLILLIGLWGSFSPEDILHFTPLDNSKQCAYVMDTSLTGSVQISRLCQMKKAGDPRFLLAAF